MTHQMDSGPPDQSWSSSILRSRRSPKNDHLGGSFCPAPRFLWRGSQIPRVAASLHPARGQLRSATSTGTTLYATDLLYLELRLFFGQLLYLAEAPLVGADLRPETEVSHVVSQCASSLAW